MIKYRDTGWHQISVPERKVGHRLSGNRVIAGFARPEIYVNHRVDLIRKYPNFELYEKLYEEFGGYLDYFFVSAYRELSQADRLLSEDHGVRDELTSNSVAFKYWLHPDADGDLMLLKLAGHEPNKIAYHETQMLTMPQEFITNYIHVAETSDMPKQDTFAYAQSRRVERTETTPAEMPRIVKEMLNAK